MLRRFNEVFTNVDVILVTGDHIAHKVSPHLSDEGATKAQWDAVKANLEASANLI